MNPAPIPLHIIPHPNELAYTPRFTRDRLTTWRQTGDPVADDVVKLLAKRGDLPSFSDLLGEVRHLAKSEGGVFQAFLDACNDVPDWADFDRMRLGQQMLSGFPVHMAVSLFAGGLVGGAVFQKMAIITGMTGMLSGDSSRRLNETSALVLKMSFEGSMQPGGDAHEVLLRVRLLHGAIRHFLVSTGRFKHPTEVPINQHDLAITLGLFGFSNIRGLARMGIEFETAELDAFTLLWRYAGHILGIDDELLPRTIEDQQELFHVSLLDQAKPEKLSPATKKVMDDVAKRFGGTELGVRLLRDFLYQSCRYLTGDDYVTGMQLPNAGDDHWSIRTLQALGRASTLTWRHVPGASRLMAQGGAAHYRYMLGRMSREDDGTGQYRVRTAR